jgi:D,D-heptose 1,7-bisphosphate phosphatase
MAGVSVEGVLQAAVELLDGSLNSRHSTYGAPAVFLDRDGTIVEDPGYLRDPGKIQFIPGALDALRTLQRAGYRLVLVTNQAGVARGLLTETDVRRVNDRLISLLKGSGVHLDGIYYCPHHPDYGPPEYRRDCDCRKPRPGMIHRAIRELLEDRHPRRIAERYYDPALRSDFHGLPRPIFLGVGRVAVEKNFEAFLALDLPGSKVVIGDGPMLEELQRRHPEAHFLGKREGVELARLYASADVFVFPSRTDTFGLVLLEALASGLPVAAYPVPGPLDIIDGSGVGVLDEDLRQAALAAVEIPRERCRAHALRYTWTASADQFVENLWPLH